MTEPIPLTPRQIYQRAYRESHKEKSREYNTTNQEKIKDYHREYYGKNREKSRLYGEAWYIANPEKARNARTKRRANTVGEITLGWIPKLLELQRWTCIVCNKDLRYGYHIDHIYPISKGGENTDYNLQALCPKCNMQKGDKDPIDFMQSRGFLI